MSWLETSGFDKKKFFNTSGIRYQELGLKDKIADLSLEAAADLLASDGMLIKRPILLEQKMARFYKLVIVLTMKLY